MQTARVFTSGRSQAVRIPKEYRFDDTEVYINRVGNALVLTPVSQVRELYRSGLNMFTKDFMQDGKAREKETKRDEL